MKIVYLIEHYSPYSSKNYEIAFETKEKAIAYLTQIPNIEESFADEWNCFDVKDIKNFGTFMITALPIIQ